MLTTQSRVLCLFACIGGTALFGQDVLKVAPAGMVKVEFENAQVRVLRFKEPAGGKLKMHSHPAYVAVALTDDSFHYTFPDGRTMEEREKAGGTTFSKAITHSGQNTSKMAVESVMVEFKTQPAGLVLNGSEDMVATNPQMCKVELDNEYVRVTRVIVPPHGALAMHSHPGPNVVVYLSGGTVRTTTGDGKTEDASIPPGTVRSNPAGKHSNENLSDKATEAVLIELKTAAN